MQLLPLLASALEFGSAAAPALTPLLKIGSWLPQDEFNVKVGVINVVVLYHVLVVPNLNLSRCRYLFESFESIKNHLQCFCIIFVSLLFTTFCFDSQVLPTVVKLFASTDRAIRVGLLQHIDTFGAGLSSQVVDEQVRKTF